MDTNNDSCGLVRFVFKEKERMKIENKGQTNIMYNKITNIMKKVFMSFVALLAIAAAATGPARAQGHQKYTSGTVAMSALQEGDTLCAGVTINKDVAGVGVFAANRWKYGNPPVVKVGEAYFNVSPCTILDGAAIAWSNDYATPVDENGNDGDAWIVTSKTGTDFVQLYLGGILLPAPPKYTVKMAPGTEDSTSWSITPAEATTTGVAQGSELTATYNGTQKVKSVKAVKYVAPVDPSAPAGLTIDLATVTAATTVEDGYTLTGTLGANVKISIADGATVTLDGVTINGVNNQSYNWAGINCLGDATIILSGTNTVKGFYDVYPGIHVPQNKTVTIQGSGSLTASSRGFGCGIGGGYNIACGNIVIAGGTITANGGGDAAGIGGGFEAGCGNISITGGTITANDGGDAAGIGSGNNGSCGNISITGGTITATGSYGGAGIGSGNEGQCGNITITNGVTSLTATKGNFADYSIGPGNGGDCGTVTIGGAVGAIETSPYTYTPGN